MADGVDDVLAFGEFAEDGVLAGEVGVGRRVMKKWLPLVPGPALAMEKMPGLVCFRPGKPIKEGADSGASRKEQGTYVGH